jgi:G:T-mismatch repair DNA endonuclease (very short patch repair protein)
MYLTKFEREQKQRQLLDAVRADPIARHYLFFDRQLWSKQEEILHAYRANKMTAVKSGNTVGKTFIAADIVQDWLAMFKEAKVITTAPTWVQVESILWKEIGRLYKTSKFPLGGDILNAEIKFNDGKFAKGISTDRVDRMQGFHSPHLLVIIDEASGVSSEIWEAIESLHPEKIVAIGNPIDPSGNFYECFNSALWHKITISCEECVKWQDEHGRIGGLVTQEWIDDAIETHGIKSAYYQVHVAGEFPVESPDSLISREWIEDARKRDLDESEEEEARLISCDVATKHGENMTVIEYRYGHTIAEMRGYQRIRTTETADQVAFDVLHHKAGLATIDTDGVGEGPADMLAERKVPVVEFHGGYGYHAMDGQKFKNLRSQFYWVVAKKFEKGLYDLTRLDAKEYEILKLQLCSIRKKNPDALGRFQIETKDDMMARGIKSPDHADCFMMGEYGFYMSRMADVKPYQYR